MKKSGSQLSTNLDKRHANRKIVDVAKQSTPEVSTAWHVAKVDQDSNATVISNLASHETCSEKVDASDARWLETTWRYSHSAVVQRQDSGVGCHCTWHLRGCARNQLSQESRSCSRTRSHQKDQPLQPFDQYACMYGLLSGYQNGGNLSPESRWTDGQGDRKTDDKRQWRRKRDVLLVHTIFVRSTEKEKRDQLCFSRRRRQTPESKIMLTILNCV